MSSLERTSLGGARKAAILLSLLGEAGAAPILRSLSSDDLERVTEEVANLPRVPVELTVQVLEEYKQMMAAQDYGGRRPGRRGEDAGEGIRRKRRQEHGGAVEPR